MREHFLIYDLEILRAIPRHGGGRLSGIEYCAGWEDHKNMGISVICAYASWTERYHIFCQDNFATLVDLAMNTAILVGFNNVRFDDSVLSNAGCEFPPGLRRYDILLEVWNGVDLGLPYQPETHAGFGLGEMARVNFGLEKSGYGEDAPVLWQQGKFGQVIDYCLNDVYLTHRLFQRILNDGFLLHPKHEHRIIPMRNPFRLD